MIVINAYLTGFTPVEYDLTSGSAATLAIPSGASYMSVFMYGPGGDGQQDSGGTGRGGDGGGFLRVVNIPIASGDWGANLTYTVGTDDPTATTLDATIAAGTINFDANAGADGSASPAGGSATANGWSGGGTVTAETGRQGDVFGDGGACGSTVAQSLEGGAGGLEGENGSVYGGGGGGSESPASAGNGATGKIKIRFHSASE